MNVLLPVVFLILSLQVFTVANAQAVASIEQPSLALLMDAGDQPNRPTNIAFDANAPQVLPQFKDLEAYLRDRVRYPETAVRAGVEGEVLLGLVIDERGEILQTQILASPSEACAEAVLSVIREMPTWQPGLAFGVPAPARVNVRFVFSLDQE